MMQESAPARAQSFPSVDAARSWVTAAIDSATDQVVCPFVSVGERHFHVGSTPLGPLVSIIEWRQATVGDGVIQVLNPYSIDSETRDLALAVWRGDHTLNAERASSTSLRLARQ